jgi:hypothetical protein
MNLDRIPKELKNLPQWVCTRGDSKVPICFETGKPASSVDPLTWGEYEYAKALHNGDCNYFPGFVFNDNGIVGIDIDDGYDADGFLSELASDIISKCGSYTEKSKSGRGFHILLKGDLPFKGKNNLKGVEIYKQSRFFIMTGDVVLYDKIVENQEAIDYIIDKYFPTTKENGTSHNTFGRIYNPIWERPQGRIPLRPVYPKITTGSRNICLTSLAGMLHNQGYSPQQILEEISYCNKVACEPMLYERELMTIVNSVTRYKR